MAAADAPRQGDRDGRGNLSLAALVDFITWFLRICLDQLDYMPRHVARSETHAPEAAADYRPDR